jgi:hypothetical protein
VLTAAGCGIVLEPAPSAAPTTPSAAPSDVRQQLDALPVAAPRSMAGYRRERFPLWSDQGGGCSTREVVLRRDGTGVRTNASCHPVAGHWVSPYDGKEFSNPDAVDIDHMVPLANAWRTGANQWTDARRGQFANDLAHPELLAVSPGSNREKGDQDPSQWKPPNRGYWCQYAQRWIAVKSYWQLTTSQAEKAALADMLGTCQ